MTKYCNSSSGRDYRLYLNIGDYSGPGGDAAAACWLEVVEAQDIDFAYTPDKIETPQRGSIYKLYDHGQVDSNITFDMTRRKNSYMVTHFTNAATEDCAWEYWLADGALDNADISAENPVTGPKGGFKCFDASSSMPISDQATMSIELAPSYFEDVANPGIEVVLNPLASSSTALTNVIEKPEDCTPGP